MTSFKQEFPAEPSPAGQSGCFEPFEFENYVNFDQTGVPTPSISPLSSRSKSVSTPTSSTSGSNTLIPVQQNPQVFAGPSHEYNLYRQQAGFAVGALANTFAVNQADQLDYGRQSYDMMLPPTDGYFGGTNTTSDFLDFNTVPSQNSSGDMDMDYGSPTNMNTLNSSYIDPATIGGQEITPRAQPAQIHPGRVYPGMHQQAALAKAQAEAKQQTMAQQQRQAASHSRQASRNGSSAKSADPFVDESISRLLNQMRHSSVASSHDDDDDAATPNANDSSYRSRKDEEDMDEDERLLASEEGKKLSSKERRQLRNKVSARAFRSRRKGT